ncbi:MAG: radical SAM family heme chaperone HemW [Sedimentisphaerales bacterium]
MPKSVYIHIPFCKSKCLYCGFYSKPPNQYDVKKVLNAEIAELKKASFSKSVQTLYIGGGSPASVGGEILCKFLSQVVELTGKANEFTVEINPADADENLLANLKNIGVNRISIGAQSFIQSELDFLGRKYSVEKIDQTIKNAKQAGFNNIGIDLIFAIPPSTSLGTGNSTLQNWRETLQKAIQNDVQHISAYSLSYEKNTPLEKTKSAGKVNVVDEELDRKMYETVIEELAKAGFEHYEISNFAKPGFKCRHNLTYWKNNFYLGIGPAAASFSGDYRIENISDIDKYVECIEQDKEPTAERIKINPAEKASQTAVLNLRLIEGIDLKEYQQKTDLDIYKFFGRSIEKNLNLKLLQLKDNRLSLTKQAMPIADSVLCDFAKPD